MTDESHATPPDDQQEDLAASAGEAAPGETEQPAGAEPAAEGGSVGAGITADPEPAGETADDEHGLSADDAAGMADAILAQVHAAVSEANAAVGEGLSGGASTPEAPLPSAAPEGSIPMKLPSFDSTQSRAMPAELDLLADVNLNVKIELGRTRLLVDDVLKLTDGAVVELDKLAGDPVDIFVNERHVARGEVLVLNDNFCVRINEIVEPEGRQVG